MLRAAWLTDIHLNFVKAPGVMRFLDSVLSLSPDIVLIGGDIGEARDLFALLNKIEGGLRRPIYFVLGNHDYYFGSIAHVRAGVAQICAGSQYLRWLSNMGIVPLTSSTCLIGHDGWGDGRCGDYENSTVVVNDFLLIKELAVAIPPGGTELPRTNTKKNRETIQKLGEDAANYIGEELGKAVKMYRHVVLLTHVPPFREAAWHQGRISSDEYLPFFTCGAMGKVLLDIMGAHPDRRMTVLCGHTHGAGMVEMLPNLVCFTGDAEYGEPKVQRILEVE